MNQIESLLERPRAYYNVDGVGELSSAVMILIFALVQWVQVHTPVTSAWHKNTWFIFMGAVAAVHYGSKAIKQHVTYPRTGFVEYSKSARRLLAPAAAAVAAIFVFGLVFAVRSHRDLSIPLSFIGLPIAAGYARRFATTVAWKWAVFGVLATGSLVITILPAGLMGILAKDSWMPGVFSARSTGACLLSLMLCGTTLLISGGISLWLYLRRTKAFVQVAR